MFPVQEDFVFQLESNLNQQEKPSQKKPSHLFDSKTSKRAVQMVLLLEFGTPLHSELQLGFPWFLRHHPLWEGGQKSHLVEPLEILFLRLLLLVWQIRIL